MLKVRHLYTATYRETRTAAVYNSKWRTTRINSRQRSAISGCPLPERTDFGPAIATRRTHLCSSQPHYMALAKKCFPAATHYFSSEYSATNYCYSFSFICLGYMEGWVGLNIHQSQFLHFSCIAIVHQRSYSQEQHPRKIRRLFPDKGRKLMIFCYAFSFIFALTCCCLVAE